MPVNKTRDVFRAISDPRRRSIMELLSKKPMKIGAITERFDISGPAISEQMKILRECRMLTVTRQGKRKYYTINIKKLDRVIFWIEKLKQNKITI
jgi:DNA-binding transcriptional ArsR family regulator